MSVSIAKFTKSGIGIFLSAIFGIGIIKVISLREGPEYLGIFGVFRQFFQLLTVVFTLGSGFSLIEATARAKEKEDTLRNLSGYVFWLSLGLSVIVFIFQSTLAEALLGDSDFSHLFGSLPLVIFFMSYSLFMKSASAGLQEILKSGFIGSFFYLFMFFAAFFTLDISRLFFIAGGLSFLASLVIFEDRKNLLPKLKVIRLPSFEKTSLATITTGVIGFFSFLFIRSICLKYLGAIQGGYLESAWSLVSYSTLVFLTSLSVYYLPYVSKNPSDLTFRKFFFLVINFLSLFTLIILSVGKEQIILLLFSEDFLPSSKLLELMCIGEYFKCISWFFVFSMISLSMKKQYLFIDVLSNLAFVLMPFLVPNISLLHFGYFYICFQLIYLIGVLFINFKQKIIPGGLALLNIGLGSIVWIAYLYIRY